MAMGQVREAVLTRLSRYSFPGGKCDPVSTVERAGPQRSSSSHLALSSLHRLQTDASLYDTALREAHEELGIHPSQVEYVGRLKLRARQADEEEWVEDASGTGGAGGNAHRDVWDDGPIRSLGGLMVWAFVVRFDVLGVPDAE